MLEEKSSWFSRLKQGLSKSSSKVASGIADIFTKQKLSKDNLDELEELLIMADFGVEASLKIIQNLAKDRFDKEISAIEIKEYLANIITDILQPFTKEIVITNKPHVILICGVNGNGKTTTTGKLAHFYKSQGKKVLLAACDTFRAAATEQLAIWAKRCESEIMVGKDNADPSSVAYDAYKRAISEDVDVLLIDTAGRLQNKAHLMEELAKIMRTLNKLDESAPHNTILVLDATTGQNANSQAEAFGKMVHITDLIITKLDGTAKAGVVVDLVQKFALNICAIGIGEKTEDLRPFIASEFARSLVGLYD